MENIQETNSGAHVGAEQMQYKFIDVARNYPAFRGDGYRYDPIFEVTSASLVYFIRAFQPFGIQRVA